MDRKALLCLLLLLFPFSQSWGDDTEQRIKALEEASKAQANTIEEQQRVINELKVRPASAPNQTGGGRLKLIDISMDALFAAGGSTEDDESLQNLEGGGHDPRKRGFTVQNVELSFAGAVDPYLTGESHIVFFLDPLTGETVPELEEMFMTTTSLPYGLQVKAGHFFTEFGRLNPQHPHQWHWQDQPVINTRFFGPDGMRGPGIRLGWLMPLPWYSEFYAGVQNANGETMASFLANKGFFGERPIGGRPFVNRKVKGMKDLAYLTRLENSWDMTDDITAKLGVSGLYGPNATGDDGETFIYGADLVVKWRPAVSMRGWPFVIWESEVMKRDYKAAAFYNGALTIPMETLHDWGFYTQLLYGFTPNWASGLRYDYASGSGESIGGRDADPFRGDRSRLSPLISWMPSEFSRFRVQYNYDRADRLSNREAHSVWLGLEFMYGAHAAHKF